MRPVIGYIRDHWQGRHGLGWSFWVNLVALRAVIFIAQEYLKPPKGSDYSALPATVLALAFLFHGVVFVWQVVGVLRAGEAHFRERGSMAHVWGAQIGCLAAFWLTASYALETWQMTIHRPPERDILAEMDREHASRYTMDLSKDGSTIMLRGSIELGVTRALGELFAASPGLRRLVIESDGGNIYEARGIARLLRENRIESRVEASCTSACTTAYIGGSRRTLSGQASLGFHQYRVDAGYAIVITDPQREMERDREVFRKAGVAPWFIDRMFSAEATGMWFPEPRQLLEAGVVHAITD